jgi:hypothetical protein
MKVARLPALCTGRLNPTGDTPGIHMLEATPTCTGVRIRNLFRLRTHYASFVQQLSFHPTYKINPATLPEIHKPREDASPQLQTEGVHSV